MEGKKSKSKHILYKRNYVKYRHRKKASRNSSKMQTVALRLQLTLISLCGNFHIAVLSTRYCLYGQNLRHCYCILQTNVHVAHHIF